MQASALGWPVLDGRRFAGTDPGETAATTELGER